MREDRFRPLLRPGECSSDDLGGKLCEEGAQTGRCFYESQSKRRVRNHRLLIFGYIADSGENRRYSKSKITSIITSFLCTRGSELELGTSYVHGHVQCLAHLDPQEHQEYIYSLDLCQSKSSILTCPGMFVKIIEKILRLPRTT